MSRVAGADGCKAGWICVIRDLADGGLEALLVEDANRLVTLALNWDVLAVDIPIGLTERGRRSCDDEARKVLGWPRRNSVFPAPIRSALAARTREEASAITKLEWEVKRRGQFLDGTNTETSVSWLDTGTAGAVLNEIVSDLEPGDYHWRMRLLYDPATSPFAQASRCG